MIQPIGSSPVSIPSTAVLPAMTPGIPNTKMAMISAAARPSSAAQ